MAWTYLQPTNYEIVRLAEAIVIGRASEFRTLPSPYGERSGVRFQVVEVIKGPFPENRLDLEGDNRFLGTSDPADFKLARPGADSGGCQAYDYRLGELYVLLLQKLPSEVAKAIGTGWAILPFSFVRANEEVARVDAPWAEAVRRYADVRSPFGSPEERSALLELQRLARAEPASFHFPLGLAADIERHFKKPTDQKSAQQLVALFREPGASKHDQEAVLIALGNRKDPEGVLLVRDLISRKSNLGEWRASIARIAGASNDERLVDWLFEQARDPSLDYSSRWSILGALVEGEGSRPVEKMLELLRADDDTQAVFISAWFRRNPSQAAVEELFRRLRTSSDEEAHLAIALAGFGDERVLGGLNPATGGAWRNSWTRSYALAASPLEAADGTLRRLLSESRVGELVEVAQGLAESKAPQRDRRLREIFEQGPADKKLRCWLLRASRKLAFAEPENPEPTALVSEIEAFHQGDRALPAVCD